MMAVIDGPTGIEDITLTSECQTHHWHAHHYDHWTTVINGRGILTLAGHEPRELGEGEKFLVPAGMVHQIKALEVPFRFQCEFLHRDADGNPVPTFVGNVEAYF